MFCKNCGFSIPDDSKFCLKCGALLQNDDFDFEFEKENKDDLYGFDLEGNERDALNRITDDSDFSFEDDKEATFEFEEGEELSFKPAVQENSSKTVKEESSKEDLKCKIKSNLTMLFILFVAVTLIVSMLQIYLSYSNVVSFKIYLNIENLKTLYTNYGLEAFTWVTTGLLGVINLIRAIRNWSLIGVIRNSSGDALVKMFKWYYVKVVILLIVSALLGRELWNCIPILPMLLLKIYVNDRSLLLRG